MRHSQAFIARTRLNGASRCAGEFCQTVARSPGWLVRLVGWAVDIFLRAFAATATASQIEAERLRARLAETKAEAKAAGDQLVMVLKENAALAQEREGQKAAQIELQALRETLGSCTINRPFSNMHD